MVARLTPDQKAACSSHVGVSEAPFFFFFRFLFLFVLFFFSLDAQSTAFNNTTI